MSFLIDTSVFAGYWPFRHLNHRDPEQLKQYLLSRGVAQAWVSSAEAILYPDPMQGNWPLLMATREDAFFVPVTLVDITLATWRKDAEQCITRLGSRAIKITPNYHSYPLDHPSLGELATVASDLNLPLCIQVRMMDERTHHPLMKVPGVPPAQIAKLAEQHPGTRFLVCGVYMSELKALNEVPNIWCEISHVEASQSLIVATRSFPWQRLVFGSHSPFLYFEGAHQKLDVKTEGLAAKQIDAIRQANALALLNPPT
ncbi:MAG: amidohydrolase family protein [Limnochordia bacterium]